MSQGKRYDIKWEARIKDQKKKGDGDLAEIANQELPEQNVDTQKGKFLTFMIGDESYGIEIGYVKEIIGIQTVAQVPELPEYIRGIINLRGKIIPVMDVRLRFKKTYREYNDRTCIVVVDIQDLSIGLIVDNVSEVLSIAEDDIVPPPDSSTGFSNRYIKGIGKVNLEVKLILDCQKLLNDDAIASVTTIM